MTRPSAGEIVIVDWRTDARPKEPTRTRPAVVVEDTELFPDAYPNILVVPLTSDEGLAHRAFAEPLEPTADSGVPEHCWALAHHVTSVSLGRVTTTSSWVTPAQLGSIRRRLTLAIGGDETTVRKRETPSP